MSIWGSLLGGVIGFSFGGPFGALLGSFLGGKISRLSSAKTIGKQQNSQEIFALSLIVLSAKLSKADGQVSKEELIAVKDKLQIPDSEIDQVAKIFNKAKDESTGYEPYAKQIGEIFQGNINCSFHNHYLFFKLSLFSSLFSSFLITCITGNLYLFANSKSL